MHTNIRCAVVGCTNPVIGQCTGYQGNCGKFYCAQHSDGTLCADCASQKAADEQALAIQQDYVQTAQRVEQEARNLALKTHGFLLLVIGSIVLLIISPAFGSAASLVSGVCLIGAFVAVTWYDMQRRQFISQLVAQYDKTKPDFSRFYAEWRAEKNKQALVNGLKIAGVIALVTLAGAASSIAEDERRSADYARLRDAVDDELRRRGL